MIGRLNEKKEKKQQATCLSKRGPATRMISGNIDI
jgi:hypothetical protein